MTIKQIVEDNSTPSGKVFDLAVQALIVVSLIAFSVETLPDLSNESRSFLRRLEVFTVVVFTTGMTTLMAKKRGLWT